MSLTNSLIPNLPDAIRSRMVPNINGMNVHILEAGFERTDAPGLLLLHGFPELAYSWRKVMLPLAQLGFHVIAPDQRGYGQTTGWTEGYDVNLAEFSMLSLVDDCVSLLNDLGYDSIPCAVGHDFGSPVAAYAALTRPEIFRSVVMMSAPFEGPPKRSSENSDDLDAVLAGLEPPRKHYQHYYATPEANDDMVRCEQGISDFLRAYYHHKSADWDGNMPFELKEWSGSELGKMPTYYIMNRDQTMAETVAPFMPSDIEVDSNDWITEPELAFYAQQFSATGFQGGLNWYRCNFDQERIEELSALEQQTIDVPSCFIAGRNDWGVYQRPGAFEAMQAQACTQMLGCHLVDEAGHWVQQEQPEQTVAHIKSFLRQINALP